MIIYMSIHTPGKSDSSESPLKYFTSEDTIKYRKD